MVKDPYEVLGISPNASADEVKKAYRKKARENHPDLNPNDPKAAERMNEVNEAYDRIVNPEKYAASDARAAANSAGGQSQANPFAGNPYARGSYTGAGQQGQGGYQTNGPYGWTTIDFDDLFGFGGFGGAAGAPIHPEASATDSATVRSAIEAINAGRYDQAVSLLSSVVSAQRDARWFYLSALANKGAGNMLRALEHIRKAVKLDPNNADYRRAYQQFQAAGQSYQEEGGKRGFSMNVMDPGFICCGLCLAQYACAAMGRGVYF